LTSAQIVEPGEECDCGFTQGDCDRMGDACCQPHKADDGASGCKRKPRVRSPRGYGSASVL